MILIDANIFMYAGGRASPQRRPCREFLRGLLSAEPPAVCTDAEVLQEILHRYRALESASIGFEMLDSIASLPIPVLAITESDVLEARRLMERLPKLSARDAVHLGAMRSHGIERVLSYDRGFDEVGWVLREEP